MSALLTLTSAHAQQVSEQEALQKAQQFLNKASQTNASRGRAPRKAPELMLANNRSEFYVFNDRANGGYVVVSGDERMPDVLAYSYDGQIDANNVPCNMQAWLEEYAEQVKYLRAHPEAKATRRTATERENVGPLLTCWFSQGFPDDSRGYYNIKCPKVGDSYCYTGCVATAMAQIMYYYQWPKQTTDTIPGYQTASYQIDIPTTPVTMIDWDNMLSEYQYYMPYSDRQIDAISTLMMLCGTSVQMDYWIKESGAKIDDARKAFPNYFGYDDMIESVWRERYNTDEWEKIMYDELKDRRPILYSGHKINGAGHAFVLDGYVDGYFHINWGWGGAESYVLMTDVEGWTDFVEHHGAVIGIQPSYPDSSSRYAVFDNGKMTFYFDNKKFERSGTILRILVDFPYYIQSSEYSEKITECIIDPSYANVKQRDLSNFFCGWKNLKSIQGIENLNTSKARNMESMFAICPNLESLDLSSFKTDNVISMGSMFSGCSSLTKLDLRSFKTDNVTDMTFMFCNCTSLTDLDVSSFKTDNVTKMYMMFYNCSSLKSLNVSNFKTDKVTSMSQMFYKCTNLTSLDVSNFNTNNVTDMDRMFYECYNLTSLDVGGFKTDNVTDMRSMFENCSSLTSLNISNFNTSNVTDMSRMFHSCTNLTSLDVSSFKTDNVTDMSWMFTGCDSLRSLDVSGFKTDNVTDMKFMFSSCEKLTKLDVSRFNTENVRDMSYMFNNCESLTSLDVSGFKTHNVTDMYRLFNRCLGLTTLDLSGFITDNVKNMKYMFSNCPQLSTIYVSELWNMSNVEDADDMFYSCSSLVGGAGTIYDENHTDGEYAHVDGGPDNPGYFTYKEIPDAINAITPDLQTIRIYDLQGKRLDNVRKGLNIIRTSDGTIKKVVIK